MELLTARIYGGRRDDYKFHFSLGHRQRTRRHLGLRGSIMILLSACISVGLLCSVLFIVVQSIKYQDQCDL
jgi:hypothetical protein